MTLDEWNDLVNSLRAELAEARSKAMRLAGLLGEAHSFIDKIAYGPSKPGGRPLAGGVSMEAQAILKSHGYGLAAPEPSGGAA